MNCQRCGKPIMTSVGCLCSCNNTTGNPPPKPTTPAAYQHPCFNEGMNFGERERAELRAENARLAASQCPEVEGDERGHAVCRLQRMAENEKLDREVLEWIANYNRVLKKLVETEFKLGVAVEALENIKEMEEFSSRDSDGLLSAEPSVLLDDVNEALEKIDGRPDCTCEEHGPHSILCKFYRPEDDK